MRNHCLKLFLAGRREIDKVFGWIVDQQASHEAAQTVNQVQRGTAVLMRRTILWSQLLFSTQFWRSQSKCSRILRQILAKLAKKWVSIMDKSQSQTLISAGPNQRVSLVQIKSLRRDLSQQVPKLKLIHKFLKLKTKIAQICQRSCFNLWLPTLRTV